MSEETNNIPKVFISYSWSSPEHEKWVLELATDLVESGIHIIIDKWDLKEGADKYVFMEKMVTDKNIRKVIIISDKVYSEKADVRKGGVGSETQIISSEIYNQLDPTSQEQKFVAVITEKDETDKPYLPTFLKSRIFIDFTNNDEYAESLEKLIRWIFDKPLFKRPDIGKPPIFITEDSVVNLGTTSKVKLVFNALSKDQNIAIGLYADYLDHFANQMEELRITTIPEGKHLDDVVIESINRFLPYRDEYVDVLNKIIRNTSAEEFYTHVHNFFEKIIPYIFWPPNTQSWNKLFADNYRFILHELFLYTMAVLIKHNRFDIANSFIEQSYYLQPCPPDVEGGLKSFLIFRVYLDSLNQRNDRLQLKRLSLMSDLLEQRSRRKDVTFVDIMQTDFILFLRADMIKNIKYSQRWSPFTLLYTSFRNTHFEKFLRAESEGFFIKFKTMLGVLDVNEFKTHLNKYAKGELKVPTWEFETFEPSDLANQELLCTKP